MENKNKQNETYGLTEKDFNEFLTATGEEQFRILLAHAEKNKKAIRIRRMKTMEQYNAQSYEEISKQFEEFCHTKRIAAKCKVAFANMAASARKQKEADKARLEEVKRRSAEANPEFTEFLHTKGLVAKIKLIGANLKKGCKEAPRKTAAAVDAISAQTRANIERAQANVRKATAGYGGKPCEAKEADDGAYTAEELTEVFRAFLQEKGLDGEFAVEIEQADE